VSERLIEYHGHEISVEQVDELVRLVAVAEPDTTHWHFNDCGCCITFHGPDYAYVIDRAGESTFFANRGCDCEHE